MSEKRRIDLALQGDGAHGALTWGVMDRLLEDERIERYSSTAFKAGQRPAELSSLGNPFY